MTIVIITKVIIFLTTEKYFCNHRAMESNICKEMRAFLAEHNLPARRLGLEAGVDPVIITRILAGVRKDMTSSNADAIREAMRRMAKAQ
jgi:hypothetical protein